MCMSCVDSWAQTKSVNNAYFNCDLVCAFVTMATYCYTGTAIYLLLQSFLFDSFPRSEHLLSTLPCLSISVGGCSEMNCSNDSSNCSYLGESQSLNGPGFGSFCLLMALLGVAASALTVLTVVALCMARSMGKQLRIYLINMLVAVLVMAGALLIFSVLPVVLVFADTELPPITFCRMLAWLFGVSGYARPLSVTAYSVVVLAIVRFGKKDWKMLYSVLSIVMLWIIALVVNINFLVPSVSAVQYFEGVVCFTDTSASNTGVLYVFSFIRIVFGNIIPLAVCIIIPVYCLWFIKKHTVTGDAAYQKAITRLALFLVTGNAVNAAASLLILICAYFSAAFASVYILLGFGMLSLLSTPIFVIIFIKLVRDQMKDIITCHYRRSNAIQPLEQKVL